MSGMNIKKKMRRLWNSFEKSNRAAFCVGDMDFFELTDDMNPSQLELFCEIFVDYWVEGQMCRRLADAVVECAEQDWKLLGNSLPLPSLDNISHLRARFRLSSLVFAPLR